MNSLLDIDRKVFFFINQRIHNSFLDTILVPARNPDLWIPLYVVLVVYFIWRFKKYSWIVLVFAGLTFLITDQLSSDVIKPLVHRIRPCHDPDIGAQVRVLVGCGPGFSFPSSHATNHFGLAFFLIIMMKKTFRWITPVAILWAAIISFAQIYVGLHYPIDVIGGMLIGAFIGMSTGIICRNILRKKTGMLI